MHSKRSEHALLEEGIKPLTADRLHNEAEHVGAQIRVLVMDSRLVVELGVYNGLAGLIGGTGNSPQIAAGGEPGAMGKELSDGNLILQAAGEAGYVALDRRVEFQLAVIVENHRRRRRADHLGERGEVVERTGGNDWGLARPVESAVALLDNRRTLPADDHRGSWVATLADAAQDHPVNRFQAGR